MSDPMLQARVEMLEKTLADVIDAMTEGIDEYRIRDIVYDILYEREEREQ